MAHPDFLIAGAGIIGLSLALELNRRGALVVVLEAGKALHQTTFAAAGMLAVEDRANPAALYELAQWSNSLYPEFLDRVEDLGGFRVPFQTTSTFEAIAGSDYGKSKPSLASVQITAANSSFRLINERSVDPRQLGDALRAAVASTSIKLREEAPVVRVSMSSGAARIETINDTLEAATFVDCMGSWSPAPVVPRKGQIFAVKIPIGLDLTSVIRTDDVYIVPRTSGPNAGRAIIGATIEDAGFDTTVHASDILALHAHAARLLPSLADAEFLESWAGLRPATIDGLPVLGLAPGQPRYMVATGHFRNGILLAPGTARALAQLLAGETPSVDLKPFSPARFPHLTNK